MLADVFVYVDVQVAERVKEIEERSQAIVEGEESLDTMESLFSAFRGHDDAW